MKKQFGQPKPASAGQLRQFGVMAADRARKLGMTNRQLQGCIISGPLVRARFDQAIVDLLLDPKVADAAIKTSITTRPKGYFLIRRRIGRWFDWE
jgi:hypothetical protein